MSEYTSKIDVDVKCCWESESSSNATRGENGKMFLATYIQHIIVKTYWSYLMSFTFMLLAATMRWRVCDGNRWTAFESYKQDLNIQLYPLESSSDNNLSSCSIHHHWVGILPSSSPSPHWQVRIRRSGRQSAGRESTHRSSLLSLWILRETVSHAILIAWKMLLSKWRSIHQHLSVTASHHHPLYPVLLKMFLLLLH